MSFCLFVFFSFPCHGHGAYVTSSVLPLNNKERQLLAPVKKNTRISNGNAGANISIKFRGNKINVRKEVPVVLFSDIYVCSVVKKLIHGTTHFLFKKVHEVRRFDPNGVFFEENIGANLEVSINITTFVPGIYNLSKRYGNNNKNDTCAQWRDSSRNIVIKRAVR